MGMNVQVKYTGEHTTSRGAEICEDCTVGNVYAGTLAMPGDIDPFGMEVVWDNELWVESDDVGSPVVTTLDDGFELVG